jgi:hypothetical protein
MDVNKLAKEYCEQLNGHKFDYLDETDQFLERQTIKLHSYISECS